MRVIGAIKSFLGYTWAIAVIFVAAMGFANMDYFIQKLVYDNGIHVSENWTGGAVETVILNGRLKTSIHEPVFRGVDLFNRKGYVQIDWSSDGKLPGQINEAVDFDKDGNKDFSITLNTLKNEAELEPYSERVLSLSEEKVLEYENSRTIRVILLK